jgi:glyoxylase-like metal-dependent hydrolase (beta-lactamase superfamily II)
MGFPKEEILNVNNHPGYNQRGRRVIDHHIVTAGDIINVGEYSFEVVDLAGHTPGQIGLYEKRHKLLFCGDHILNKITPNITFWGDDFDALGVYLDKLKDVRKMDVKILFTAHRAGVDSHVERIDQLLAHHQRRLDLCIKILKEKPSTVFEVASKLNWISAEVIS